MPLAHVDIPRGVFGVGGALEIGGRIKLPYGAFAFSLRPQYEYFALAPVLRTSSVVACCSRTASAAWMPLGPLYRCHAAVPRRIQLPRPRRHPDSGWLVDEPGWPRWLCSVLKSVCAAARSSSKPATATSSGAAPSVPTMHRSTVCLAPWATALTSSRLPPLPSRYPRSPR